MKNIISYLLVILVIAGIAGYLVSDLRESLDGAQYQAKLEKARTKLLRQSNLMLSAPNERVDFDRTQVLKDYRADLEKIFKEHPTQNREDAYLQDLEKDLKEGKQDTGKASDRKQRYTENKELYGKYLKDGNAYKPLLTAYSNGVRMDIMDIRPSTESGQKALRMDVFFWGTIKDQFSFQDLEIQFVREQVTVDARGKEQKKQSLGKIQGQSTPSLMDDDAFKRMPEWPLGVVPAYYEGIPLFAPDAARFSMKMNFVVRASGGTTMPLNFKWDNVEIKPEWRAPPGAEWQAIEQTASAEELAAAGLKVDPNQK